MSDVDTDNTASLLSQRSKEAEMAMPAVEDFFRVVAHKVRARLVNRSSVDIPVRVAGVEVKSLGAVLEDSEYREGSIYSLLRFNPLGMPGMIVLQGALLGRIVGTMLGEDPEEESQMGAVKALTPVEQKIAHRECAVTTMVARDPCAANRDRRRHRAHARSQGTFGTRRSSPQHWTSGHRPIPMGCCAVQFPCRPFGRSQGPSSSSVRRVHPRLTSHR